MSQTKTRQLLHNIESEITRLRGVETAPAVDWSHLLAAFNDLTADMALGPEPETRPCPACGRLGRRNATVCGYCWTKTPPHTGA